MLPEYIMIQPRLCCFVFSGTTSTWVVAKETLVVVCLEMEHRICRSKMSVLCVAAQRSTHMIVLSYPFRAGQLHSLKYVRKAQWPHLSSYLIKV